MNKTEDGTMNGKKRRKLNDEFSFLRFDSFERDEGMEERTMSAIQKKGESFHYTRRAKRERNEVRVVVIHS